jgi:hypothetical protein
MVQVVCSQWLLSAMRGPYVQGEHRQPRRARRSGYLLLISVSMTDSFQQLRYGNQQPWKIRQRNVPDSVSYPDNLLCSQA